MLLRNSFYHNEESILSTMMKECNDSNEINLFSLEEQHTVWLLIVKLYFEKNYSKDMLIQAWRVIKYLNLNVK